MNLGFAFRGSSSAQYDEGNEEEQTSLTKAEESGWGKIKDKVGFNHHCIPKALFIKTPNHVFSEQNSNC